MMSSKAPFESELGVLVDYKSMPSGGRTLANTLTHAYRIPAPIHRALTLAYRSLRSNRRSICNGWEKGVRKVVNMNLGNVTHWRTERTEREKG